MTTRSFTRDEVLRSLPPASVGLVETVLAVADGVGARILIVGGPVRDLLLDRPVRDVDLIVEAADGKSAEAAVEVARRAAPEDARVVEHGRFGTVRIETAEASIDLAGLRSESYSRPGALPDVAPGSLEEDMARRDFTVNALAIGLEPGPAEARLSVIDLVGGLADVKARRLRVIHKRSFHDDPTRALRAARLAPRLRFSLARETRASLRDALRDGAFGAVSGDRLRREIEKCFTDASLGLDPPAALKRLSDWHVLTALEPGLALPREVVTALRRFGRITAEPPWKSARYREWIAGLAIWLSPFAPALRRRALARLSVRGDAATRIRSFPKFADTTLRQLAKARGRGAVDVLLAGVAEEELHALHAIAETPMRRRIERWAAEDRARRVPVSGAELTALGLEGPAVGRVLARLRAAVLDGEVANREEAMALAEELVRRSARRQPARRRKGAKPRRAKAARTKESDPGAAQPKEETAEKPA
jgi:tRNA nucleotidyltransferase (CCA-adding enzyme)